MVDTSLKKGFGGKITYKLGFFFMERKAFFIFSYEEQSFGELWIAVSYFALEAIVGWCSLKVGVLRKAILKYSSSEPLWKSLKKNCNGCFFSRIESVKPAALLKNDFLHNYLSRIKTSFVEQLF